MASANASLQSACAAVAWISISAPLMTTASPSNLAKALAATTSVTSKILVLGSPSNRSDPTKGVAQKRLLAEGHHQM